MVFEKNRKHIIHYDIDEGTITVGVTALTLECSLSECGGRIDINYSVEIDNEFIGENTISFRIFSILDMPNGADIKISTD